MSHIEASERWVSERLVALAGALHLVGPVRDGFGFPADLGFYAECTESIVSLQKAARRIIDHIGLACDSVVVLWGTHVATERADGAWFVTLDRAYAKDGIGLGALLAREVCRILLAHRNILRCGATLDAVHVELAVMLTGLGALTLNALAETEGTPRADRTLGVLRPHLLVYAHARVGAALSLPHRLLVDYLRSPTSRQVTWTWLRASRRRLPFRKVGDHVIMRCRCSQRLRVPAGKVGAMTCPGCKTKRELDGRACAIAHATAPVPMVRAT